METKEHSQQATESGRRSRLAKSLAVLAVGLGAVVGTERLAHGEQDCMQRDDTYEIAFDISGCIEDLTGIDPINLVAND